MGLICSQNAVGVEKFVDSSNRKAKSLYVSYIIFHCVTLSIGNTVLRWRGRIQVNILCLFLGI